MDHDLNVVYGFKKTTKDVILKSLILRSYNSLENTLTKLRKMGLVTKAVSLMKSYLFPLIDEREASDSVMQEQTAKLESLIVEFDLADDKVPTSFLLTIMRIFRESLNDRNVIDFDDQICYPYYHSLPVAKVDYMIVDESQDLSPNKLELVSRGVGKHFICVGDPLQAIYGFCGADSESMDKIEQRFSPLVLSLPVTYRCGKQIVQETHKRGVAPADFQAGEKNHEGEVRRVLPLVFQTEVRPKDFVLCRANAPLIAGCFDLIKRGIRAMVIGRDVGGKLAKLADKINDTRPTNPNENEMLQFAEKMARYAELEVGKLRKADKERQAEILEDALDCLAVFVQNVQSFAAMKDKICTMFDDKVNPDAVVFSTIHKAKGLESDVVWSLPFKMGGKKKLTDKKAQEERNLEYVKITRAKKQFNYVLEESK